MRRPLLIFWALLCAVIPALCSSPLTAQPDTAPVFRIGVFDKSSTEFAASTPKSQVNFIAGISTPANSWYARQGIKSRGEIPERIESAPRKITFALAHPPVTAYRLHLSILIETFCVPFLQVSINGKKGDFFLHPTLDYSNGDQEDFFQFVIHPHEVFTVRITGHSVLPVPSIYGS